MGHRYIGSKTKILDFVLNEVSKVVQPGSHVVDLMTGTASVATALRAANYKVTAADVMTYSYHHAKVSLELSGEPSFTKATLFIKKNYKLKDEYSNYEKLLYILNILPGTKGYFWNEFSIEGSPKNSSKSRNYFSATNAIKIDAIRACIKMLSDSSQITETEHSLLLHDLIMATNDIANISGTYGHYLSKLMGRARQTLLLKPTIFRLVSNNEGHEVIRGYAEEISKSISCDLCYIDPPYMKRQYAANYHILETLAREDSPEAMGESGLRPWRDQYSNFCTKTNVRSAFSQIFTEMDSPNFLISYSEDGLLTIVELEDFLKQYGSVRVVEVPHRRFKSNQSKLSGQLTEYLIHLQIKN